MQTEELPSPPPVVFDKKQYLHEQQVVKPFLRASRLSDDLSALSSSAYIIVIMSQQRIKENSKQRRVPSSQIGRLWHFGGAVPCIRVLTIGIERDLSPTHTTELGVRMGIGALGEATMRTLGLGSSTSAHPAITAVRLGCFVLHYC